MAIHPGRVTARFPDALALFIIGLRVNKLFPVQRWLKVARAMPPMIAELKLDPDSGFLHGEQALSGLRTIVMIQYWRSFDALEAYARDPDQTHWPAWRAFNKTIGNDGSVGIFHETYLNPAGARETIYVNMPPFGLGVVDGTEPVTGAHAKARQRLHNG